MATPSVLTWLEKSFNISREQILSFSGLNASHSFKTEEKKNGKNMPKTKEVSPGIGTMSFDVHLDNFQGNDVKDEYEWWTDACEKGTYSYLYIGGEKFGKYKWRVNKVDVSDLQTIYRENGKDEKGNTIYASIWKSCTLSIGFEEYFVAVKLTKAEKKALRLQKKMRRQIEKAQNAKNDKARDKALEKAKSLAADYMQAKVEAAEARAKQAEVISKIDEKINEILYPPMTDEEHKEKEEEKKGAA